jgi:phosphoadenosine phosphosulfate reductase
MAEHHLKKSPQRGSPAVLGAAVQATADLVGRVRLVAQAVPGRIAFSTSLGLEDQAILHAIAESGCAFDVFTLDTGRHFPETLDTLAASELRYGIRIRMVAPDAAELEDLTSRDGVLGFRQSIDARKACCDVRKVRPLGRSQSDRRLERCATRRLHPGARHSHQSAACARVSLHRLPAVHARSPPR